MPGIVMCRTNLIFMKSLFCMVISASALLTLMGCTGANGTEAQCSAALPAIDLLLGNDPSKTVLMTENKAPQASATSVDPDVAGLMLLKNRDWVRFTRDSSGKASYQDIPMSSEERKLIDKLIKRGLGNAVNLCSDARSYILGRGSSIESYKNNRNIENDGIEKNNKHYLNEIYVRSSGYVSFPILSSDGRAAYVVASAVSGPLVGGGILVKFTKGKDGAWHKFATINLWLS